MNAPLLTPLQSTYWKQTDSGEGMVGLLIFGGAILLLLLINALVGANKRKASGGSSLLAPGRSGFSHGSFIRAARTAGLVDEHAAFLERHARGMGLVSPEFVFQNRQRLDAFFKDVFRRIDKTEESEASAENDKAILFAIREHLALSTTRGAPIRSTRQIEPKTTLSFITRDQSSHPSVLRSNEPGGMAVEPVLDALGQPQRLRRGTKLTVFFYPKARQGYSFRTRVSGYEDLGGRLAMVLKHSDNLEALPTRRHQRREMRAPCLYRRVAVELAGSGRQATRSVRVERLAYPGTVVDVSAGGLSIQSANPVETGSYLRIEFDPGNGSLTAFGSVVRMNRHHSGGIMHVRFVKISRKAINELLSYVYGYAD